MRLENKVALVTGSGNGIGKACAITYAREGAKVVIVDLTEEVAAPTVAAIRANGGEAVAFGADMANMDEVEKMIQFAIQQYGKLDILHNNTAWTPIGPVGDIEPADWQKAIDVSLTSYWYASKCALPYMIENGSGAILNTASISGMAADQGMGTYNVVKAGVINLTHSIAIDYGRKGIRCNAVCPGIVYTRGYEKIKQIDPARIEAMADNVPIGRFGTAQEIANVALFLVSDEASFVTGSCVVADGGRSAHTGTPSPVGFKAS